MLWNWQVWSLIFCLTLMNNHTAEYMFETLGKLTSFAGNFILFHKPSWLSLTINLKTLNYLMESWHKILKHFSRRFCLWHPNEVVLHSISLTSLGTQLIVSKGVCGRKFYDSVKRENIWTNFMMFSFCNNGNI